MPSHHVTWQEINLTCARIVQTTSVVIEYNDSPNKYLPILYGPMVDAHLTHKIYISNILSSSHFYIYIYIEREIPLKSFDPQTLRVVRNLKGSLSQLEEFGNIC
jgi:hypothetical protein